APLLGVLEGHLRGLVADDAFDRLPVEPEFDCPRCEGVPQPMQRAVVGEASGADGRPHQMTHVINLQRPARRRWKHHDMPVPLEPWIESFLQVAGSRDPHSLASLLLSDCDIALEVLLADHRRHVAAALPGAVKDFEKYALERSDAPALAISVAFHFFPRTMSPSRPQLLRAPRGVAPMSRQAKGSLAVLRIVED